MYLVFVFQPEWRTKVMDVFCVTAEQEQDVNLQGNSAFTGYFLHNRVETLLPLHVSVSLLSRVLFLALMYFFRLKQQNRFVVCTIFPASFHIRVLSPCTIHIVAYRASLFCLCVIIQKELNTDHRLYIKRYWHGPMPWCKCRCDLAQRHWFCSPSSVSPR